MIHVDRCPAPKVLADVNSPAAQERKKVLAFYKKLDPAGKRKAYKFAVYSHDDVKEALTELFKGKCAYCESRYAGTQPMDVEHWRPKARVLDENGKQVLGYYWLASAWTNLLPSCIDCNRERRQRLVDLGVTRSIGKAERFPIEPGTRRATKDEEIASERPLLLHPCDDHPEEHFTFTDDAVIRPRGKTRTKAETSIEVYALNRSGLVEERQQLLRLIQQRIAMIDRLARLLEKEKMQKRLRHLIEDLITHELVELSRFRRPERPYSLMARQFIDNYFERLRRDVGGSGSRSRRSRGGRS